jgi:hypothetical protein
MDITIEKLISELETVINYYMLPNANFIYSRYDNAALAIADMKDIINSLRIGNLIVLNKLKILFAPTGSIQEISIDSDWCADYVDIASRVDDLIFAISSNK